jgi:hypothetical protein
VMINVGVIISRRRRSDSRVNLRLCCCVKQAGILEIASISFICTAMKFIPLLVRFESTIIVMVQ